MDIRQLEYFIQLVDSMSYSKASEQLHISQPSLSIAIKKLEAEVGHPLLERHTRKLQLTDVGELLYARAKEILLNVKILRQELDETGKFGQGEIALGVIESVKYWVPSTIHQLKNIYPQMHFKLADVLSAAEVKKSLKTQHTHVNITNQQVEDDAVAAIKLYDEPLVIVFPKEHPLAEKEHLTLADLKNEPFIICAEGFQSRKDILTAFHAENINPNIYYEVEHFETAVSLVRGNLGITILPESYLQGPTANSIVQRNIHHPLLHRSVYLTYLRHRHLPLAMQHYIDIVKDYFHIID
ncbi:LysR family transcriptional regulator [Lysinibacillus sp. KU-BSD001]|uniref:LysR family transcriptional regulator n=1 Tax=Lysinibacillus sp. KU-BSD001 TaxID=3141328 RepID=UPI0036E9D908